MSTRPETHPDPQETAPAVSVFGIRHHGPGSARSLKRALDNLQPDCVLVEGPPEADAILPLMPADGMQPPVAILIYRPDRPGLSAFYPFAEFSPEWQAIGHAQERGVPVRFMDLPQKFQLLDPPEPEPELVQAILGAEPAGEEHDGAVLIDGGPTSESDEEPLAAAPPEHDPLGWLGRAAGYADGEQWWEHMVEQRLDGADLFAAVHEAMAALREEFPKPDGPEAEREARREAFMRKTIRQAKKDGFERIAVVCGAWHAPALSAKVKVSHDNALLKGLPKAKVAATWVPWTYGRLATASGYGAGVTSPGWYHHLWTCSEDLEGGSAQRSGIRWLTQVARLLRSKDLDCSSAHVIEAVRLAESLAAMRSRPIPSLAEMNEACLTVMTFGEPGPLQLIENELAIGERLGTVPPETPAVPLQKDIEATQRRLRLKPVAFENTLDLDLRKPSGLQRSLFLHRLGLLDIPWATRTQSGGGKGTFHELWSLKWEPEASVRIIEASLWGHDVASAASACVLDRAKQADLARLSELVDKVLPADLPQALDTLMLRLESEAARSSDVSQLMAAVPPLANILRYGDVRGTDTSQVGRVVSGLVTRVCIGLPVAVSSLDDDAASRMVALVAKLDTALRLLESQQHLDAWHESLGRIMGSASVHGLLTGRACRLLFDAARIDGEEAEKRMNLALSSGTEPLDAAAWLEGFLAGSGMVLLHDDRLWASLDRWLTTLGGEAFVRVLPLIRRTFSTFSDPERKQMGTRAKSSGAPSADRADKAGSKIDHKRAAQMLPVIRRYLGLEPTP